jgi:calreticulin
VKAGSIFDNIIVADDFAAAKKFAEDTWSKLKEAEKKMFDSISEVRTRSWPRFWLL